MPRFFFVLILLLGLLFAPRAFAQGNAPTDDQVNQVAKKLFCPVCENVPLDVCPTQACAQWRATIREKLSAGWDEQQILDYFAAQYGERVLAQPSTRGLNVFVWLIPPIVIGVGLFVLWRVLNGMTKPSAEPEAATPPLSNDAYVARLEKELKDRR